MQVITNVKIKNNTLKDELKSIEKHKSFYKYEEWRLLTINAYRAIHTVKSILDCTQTSSSTSQWQLAYTKAHQADKAINLLLSCQLDNFLSYSSFDFPSPLLLMFLSAFIIPKLCGWITRAYHLNPAQAEDLAASFVMLIIAPTLIKIIIPWSALKPRFEKILIDSSWCKHVLIEAKRAGIDIDTSIQSDELATHEPWSNAQLLADIGCEKWDKELECAISHSVMTVPVREPEGKVYYERNEIEQWLVKKNEDPLSRRALYWDELVISKELQEKAACFTHEKVKTYINKTTMTSMLEEIEMRVEDNYSSLSSYQP